jgi:hypothetical protein
MERFIHRENLELLRQQLEATTDESKLTPLGSFTSHKGEASLSRAENAAEVRRCAIIDCPFGPIAWARTRTTPKRGVNPFARTA